MLFGTPISYPECLSVIQGATADIWTATALDRDGSSLFLSLISLVIIVNKSVANEFNDDLITSSLYV